MERWFWIGLGGAAGTLARHALSAWCQERFGMGFPYGTLAVNVLGSFLLCAVMQIALTTDLISPTLRLALGTGVMGGFTTYSTFNYEMIKMLQGRAWALGALNLSATLIGCLIAGLLGMATARRILGG
ncbi:MAG: CrcB family protein [Polyangiaceae bacterium]|nr:CrcB family protein [Polyangiaceae bacterium]